MKKILFAIAITGCLVACKKSTSDNTQSVTTVYLMGEAVDNDNTTTTYSPIATVQVRN